MQIICPLVVARCQALWSSEENGTPFPSLGFKPCHKTSHLYHELYHELEQYKTSRYSIQQTVKGTGFPEGRGQCSGIIKESFLEEGGIEPDPEEWVGFGLYKETRRGMSWQRQGPWMGKLIQSYSPISMRMHKNRHLSSISLF